MITIKEDRCEFMYLVDTDTKKVMNAISPQGFEKACISADIKQLMLCIDKNYGKGTSLRMVGMVMADIYTDEDIEEADKEINEND